MFQTNKKAFTLLEMLIVIIIIGILAVALIPRLTGAQAKARDTARMTELAQIAAGLAAYNANYGEYPSVTSGSLENILVPQYLSSMPKDPQSQRQVVLISNGSDCVPSQPGTFAYSPLVRNNNPNGAMILGAYMETEGKSSNFVVDPNQATNPLQGQVNGCINSNMDATLIEKNICTQGVTLGTINNLSACTAASDKKGLRYLIIQ